MTGSVPYYGGRLTPAQTYAVTHPPHPQPPPPPPPAPSQEDTLTALQHLLDNGVVTQAEYDELRKRVDPKD
jgi:hypothetical protein